MSLVFDPVNPGEFFKDNPDFNPNEYPANLITQIIEEGTNGFTVTSYLGAENLHFGPSDIEEGSLVIIQTSDKNFVVSSDDDDNDRVILGANDKTLKLIARITGLTTDQIINAHLKRQPASGNA
ncbi:hypothetical protein IID19_05125 [Patescibacteria group bacterium]|nr:hypothetical protein [Patescibacteria group bacterium]